MKKDVKLTKRKHEEVPAESDIPVEDESIDDVEPGATTLEKQPSKRQKQRELQIQREGNSELKSLVREAKYLWEQVRVKEMETKKRKTLLENLASLIKGKVVEVKFQLFINIVLISLLVNF
jgi:hypothetical protein